MVVSHTGLEALALSESSDGLDHGVQVDDRDGEGGGDRLLQCGKQL